MRTFLKLYRKRIIVNNLKLNKMELEKMYLDYFNNFLTVRRFAEYYGISVKEANEIINLGRIINQK